MAQSTQTLAFLQQLASEDVAQAMQTVAVAMQQLAQAKQQQDMLAQYQQEYVAQLQLATQQGLKADLYRNFQGFFAQLEQAVQGQNNQVRQLQAALEQQQQQLQAKQRKQKSYEVLIQRAALVQAGRERKRDQKLMDEFASRAKRTGF